MLKLIVSFVCLAAFVPAILLIARPDGQRPARDSAVASASVSPVSIVSTCGTTSELFHADIKVTGNQATVKTVCDNDRTGRIETSTHSETLSFSVESSELRSVLLPDATGFATSTTLDLNKQVFAIKAHGGSPCASISAVSRSETPIPRRFVSSSNDWRSAIDYMVDDKCQVLAISLGNRLAILSTREPTTFSLYDVHFATSRNEGAEK